MKDTVYPFHYGEAVMYQGREAVVVSISNTGQVFLGDSVEAREPLAIVSLSDVVLKEPLSSDPITPFFPKISRPAQIGDFVTLKADVPRAADSLQGVRFGHVGVVYRVTQMDTHNKLTVIFPRSNIFCAYDDEVEVLDLDRTLELPRISVCRDDIPLLRSRPILVVRSDTGSTSMGVVSESGTSYYDNEVLREFEFETESFFTIAFPSPTTFVPYRLL